MTCFACNGTRIIVLHDGSRSIKAPCLQCSRDRALEDLEAEEAIREEKRRIEEHNNRIKGAAS